MKTTKQQLRQLIKEEIKSDPALLAAIGLLTDKIDNLDVSIDYLAGAVTGESPAALGYSQNALGRFARPIKAKSPFSDPDRMNEIEQEVRQYLSEEDNPWAICTASVGREDKEKYEKCIRGVKKQNKGKE
jgi:hypothetical protein|tara:strand:- start:2202 stop:2591 length:390 start_codon:yes stop_codon:yes gene_type:complete